MSDERKGNELSQEELVAEARKKKVQGFKLHIDDFGFGGEAPQAQKARPVAKEESVDELLGDIKRQVGKPEPPEKSKKAADNTQKKTKSRFKPPVYVEPDLDKVGRTDDEPKLESYAEKTAAIENLSLIHI